MNVELNTIQLGSLSVNTKMALPSAISNYVIDNCFYDATKAPIDFYVKEMTLSSNQIIYLSGNATASGATVSVHLPNQLDATGKCNDCVLVVDNCTNGIQIMLDNNKIYIDENVSDDDIRYESRQIKAYSFTQLSSNIYLMGVKSLKDYSQGS